MTVSGVLPTLAFTMKNNSKKLVALLVSSFAALALQGCFVLPGDDGDLEITDDSCVATCEELSSCEGQLDRDCEALCGLFREMDCDGEVEDYWACREDEGDLCVESSACEAKGDEAVGCMMDYCEENPGADGCPEEPAN